MTSRTTALITGASSGIGAVYADRLAKRGHALMLVARRADRLETLAAQLTRDYGVEVGTLTADLTTTEGCLAVEASIANDTTIGFLVNNAGIGTIGSLATTSADALSNLINVNVLALARLTLAAVQAFEARGGGTIVNIASISAFRALKNGAAYSASKAFVLNFTRSLQLEAAGTNLRVQCVLPGPVRTEFLTAAGADDSVFPDESFITAEQLVDAALVGLDNGEDVTVPTLQDVGSYERAAAAFTELREEAGRRGVIAPRYR
ncbi:hypothetical protein SAMN02800694_1744 [Luteibacter sp. UNCMF331Sha3.1]|uniref:SDR family NAD(P)-dependent oxidoreductase n=1 Tax=Luteibacter sp. UNCMF331Sha3.1 TaxID=1502760 RepID=UPI0008CDB613|nr:SDR family NAD(P)-dependent oxidoreductase [Luteibacter sp. UNCMF331Sha3.1]SEM79992.1 hypothetical protein SAMN02800694_1744 [Luteibacter sp. UNCMF331Sha3.1]